MPLIYLFRDGGSIYLKNKDIYKAVQVLEKEEKQRKKWTRKTKQENLAWGEGCNFSLHDG